ncbi:MAG: hypothetical protein R6V48_03310 [Fidelibacterota bacterium]
MRKFTFPFCFIMFSVCFCAASGSMDLLRNELSLDFPDTAADTFPFIDYTVSHQEILRESRNDTLLSRYTIRSQGIQFRHPLKSGILSGSWERGVYQIADVFQNKYIYADPRPVSQTFTLAFQKSFSRWEIKPRLGYTYSAEKDTLFIREYPRSESSAYNNYFFNLLRPTFGDTISCGGSLHQAAAAIQLNKKFKTGHLFLSLEYVHNLISFTESHVNTGPHEKIRGPRESLLFQNPFSLKYTSAWKFDANNQLRFSYQYRNFPLNWKHTLFPDDPDTLEIIELASGSLFSHALQSGYHFRKGNSELLLNVSGASLRGNLSASTPVLGYIFGILPISHQGEILGRLQYILAHIYAEHSLHAGPFSFTPRIELFAARIYSNYLLDLQLEFGLEDVHENEKYIHALYIVSPGLKAELPLNSELVFTLNAEQLIPHIKTVYPELPPQPPSDIRHYGGLSLSAGISLTW